MKAALRLELFHIVRTLRKKSSAAVGLVILGSFGILAIVPNWFSRFPPEEADPHSILLAPSSVHWFGTDINGMDVFSRIVWGARLDLLVAISSTSLALIVGLALGAAAGYYFGLPSWRGASSEVMLRAMDALQAFPVFVLALALVSVLGRNLYIVIGVLGVLGTPIFLRLTRSAVLATRSEAYVEAARCAGNSELRLVAKHILPNSLGPAFATASIVAGGAILLTAGLSFIGAGIPAPKPEWGSMVAVGAPSLYTGNWWAALFPGGAIGLAVLSFALVGDGVREYLDPVNR